MLARSINGEVVSKNGAKSKRDERKHSRERERGNAGQQINNGFYCLARTISSLELVRYRSWLRDLFLLLWVLLRVLFSNHRSR